MHLNILAGTAFGPPNQQQLGQHCLSCFVNAYLPSLLPAFPTLLRPLNTAPSHSPPADKTIPVEDGRKFAAILPGHRLVEVEGADHNFTGSQDHLQQLISAVLTFLQQEEFSLPSPRPDDSSSLASP